MSAPIRVIVAEDQALLRSSLSALLDAEDDLEVVAQAADGAEAVQLATCLRPDVVLTDIRMPVCDGIEATRLIRAALPDTRVLVLTMFEVDEYVLGALRAGASGFLLKDAEPQAVVDAVRAQHVGRRGVVSLYVNDFNTAALGLYEGLGFTRAGTFATVLL